LEDRIKVMQKKKWLILSICITLISIALGIAYFSKSYLRLIESITDLWSAVRYYVYEIIGYSKEIRVSITEYSKVMGKSIFLADDVEEFKQDVLDYLRLLITKDNAIGYVRKTSSSINGIAKLGIVVFPVLCMSMVVLKRMYDTKNTNYNEDTLPLRVYKRLMSKTYEPIRKQVIEYITYLKDRKYILRILTWIWLLNLNLVSILIAGIAYYFYFAVSFDVLGIYVQLRKLIIDLKVVGRIITWWMIVIAVYTVIDKKRRRIADERLRRMESRNCGFITELPIVSMTVGSMGKRKTTIITDMALSQSVMFRQKAFELLQKNDMKFPHFPWISFELDLRNCMHYGTVYNLATVKEWVNKKRLRFERNVCPKTKLYGYDFERYGMTYDDGLRVWNLHEILTTYAQLYFIYVIESSLLVSNYSIREDSHFLDDGNFPIWVNNFFPEQTAMEGNHAHILDFDVLRLGKKVIENNPKIGSFEFGVVVISEVGKERGNNLELRDVKKSQEETNQKNDLFNSWLKMCRHSATVDNFSFVKVFTDEQRPESWGADARDLCDIIHIASSGNQRLTLPFYTIEEMISEWAFNGFINLYYDFRFRRGDNTLLVHILKTITAWIYKRNSRIYNKYGYSISHIEKEHGTMDGKIEKKKYYVMNKKIYSRRFSTDCFSDYFNDMAKKTRVGLNDYMEYATEKATIDELKEQNSYFINSLYK